MGGVRRLSTQAQLFDQSLVGIAVKRPHGDTIIHDAETILLTWYCSQNKQIEADYASCTQRTLSLVAAINDVPMATVVASAFRMKGADNDGFFLACDSVCQSLCNFAEVVCAHWNVEDLRSNEEILVLDRIVVHPAYGGAGRMAAILQLVLDRFSGEPAITLISAFPLEHENIDPPVEPAFTRAQERLISYYAKALGVVPLPSISGRDGWLYKSTIPIAGEQSRR